MGRYHLMHYNPSDCSGRTYEALQFEVHNLLHVYLSFVEFLIRFFRCACLRFRADDKQTSLAS